MLLTRRILAALLTLVAVGVALLPPPPAVEVVVAAHDLPAGVPLGADDLRVVAVPPELSPAGAASADAARGRVLTAAARSGEPITDVRLAPPDPDAGSVAVRLADRGVAALLRPGSRVDVVGPESRVLAEDASVVERTDDLVVIRTDRGSATRVAAESLAQPLAVTLR